MRFGEARRRHSSAHRLTARCEFWSRAEWPLNGPFWSFWDACTYSYALFATELRLSLAFSQVKAKTLDVACFAGTVQVRVGIGEADSLSESSAEFV